MFFTCFGDKNSIHYFNKKVFMSINPNRPVQPTQNAADFKKSIADMNKVTGTAIEALADKIHDADGDNTQLSDVKTAFQKLSTQEKVAFGAGGAVLGAAIASISLVGEKVGDAYEEATKAVGKKAGETYKEATKAVKEASKAVEKQVDKKYKNPPEAKIVESIKNTFEDIVDGAEEFIDDVKDGRIARDVSKNVKRFHRDHFTEQGPLDKVKNKIGDAAEDAAHAAADLADDIADGRTGHKIEKKVKRAFD